MKKELLIAFLLDSSGSMMMDKGFYEATISGFNEFKASQANAGDDVQFGLWTFDSPGTLTSVIQPTQIADVPNIHTDTYNPNGSSTALYDAIVEMHDEIDKFAAASHLKTGEAPDVLFVIYTDGQNNAGKTSKQNAFKRNEQAMSDKGWQIVYLGAAVDDYATSMHHNQAASFGTKSASTMVVGASAAGSAQTFNTLSSATSSYIVTRSKGKSVKSSDYDFDVADDTDNE